MSMHHLLRIGRRSYRSKWSSSLWNRQRAILISSLDDKNRSFSSFSKEASTAPITYNPSKRWMAVPPANAVHLSIGSVYVYSMWTPGMVQALGVVSSAPNDWTHSQVLPVFSTAAVVLGVTTGMFGSWVEESGPRKAGLVGSLFWSGALLTTGWGVELHSLPLIFLGYGLLGGVGWGLMYLAPVTTVMKWFPDKRGLATGIAMSAFGAGAALAPTLIHAICDFFAVAPDFIGTLAQVPLETLPDGSQVVASCSNLGQPGQPVVVATETDVAKLPHVITGPGVYALGTGDTGTSKALWTLGISYGVLGLLGSRFMKVPHPDWTPHIDKPQETSETNTPSQQQQPLESFNVGLPVNYVTMSTYQFPLLWLVVFGNATGGLALLSSSKLMLMDIWAGVAPDLVTASFSTGYVSALGIGMAAGRFGWSALSDKLGRRNTYAVFGLGIPIVGLAPTLTHTAVHHADNVVPLLAAFYGGSMLAITFYGGIFSVLPAYIADLFGQKHAGAIHGKALTAWAASAVAGPMGLAYMRSRSVHHATDELLGKVDNEQAFEQAFGCSLNDTETINTLVDAKTITIGRLMELVPDGTVDPTPFLYDSTLYAAAGLMGVSALANVAIKPLDVKGILKKLEDDKKTN